MNLNQKLRLGLTRFVVDAQEKEHPLRQLFWECTLRCNLKCRHCGSDCKVSDVHPDMPFDDFEKVLKLVKEVYDSHKVMIVISGGEPLMRSDILDCCSRIRQLEFPWGMVSNGRLMTESMIKSLLAAGMRSATISLDGLEDDHDWMRGVPGSFKTASEAIRILAGEPRIRFDAVTCVNSRNFFRLEELKEYLISLGLKAWRIFTIFPVGRAANDPQLQITDRQYRELMDFIVATRKEGRIHLSYACEGFLGEYEGRVRDHCYTCQAGLSIASVRIDGSISGCTSIRGRFDQGNIYRDDFIDVWENRFEPFRNRDWMHTGRCGECKAWKWCRGNGMHLRDDEGNLILCNFERINNGLEYEN
ncbi:MAG: TIGR04133 family radical SAM/SPASM protein [Bacteroidales bacterium]|nr:TIGR04133 family radical SAM/SPASM protein [Bacteroidales bacterium]